MWAVGSAVYGAAGRESGPDGTWLVGDGAAAFIFEWVYGYLFVVVCLCVCVGRGNACYF